MDYNKLVPAVSSYSRTYKIGLTGLFNNILSASFIAGGANKLSETENTCFTKTNQPHNSKYNLWPQRTGDTNLCGNRSRYPKLATSPRGSFS